MTAIRGIGLDVVQLTRLAQLYERHGERFLRRICREGEVKPRRGEALIQHLGGLFAAKEAVLKALGTGWAEGLGFRDVEIVAPQGKPPRVRLHDLAAERAAQLGMVRLHVSITHDQGVAAAVAILEAEEA